MTFKTSEAWREEQETRFKVKTTPISSTLPQVEKIKRKMIKAPRPLNEEDNRGVEEENDTTKRTKTTWSSDGSNEAPAVPPSPASNPSAEEKSENELEELKRLRRLEAQFDACVWSTIESMMRTPEQLEELKELRQTEAVFDAWVWPTVESMIRTPEHSRLTTPTPEDDDEAAADWMETEKAHPSSKETKDTATTPKKTPVKTEAPIKKDASKKSKDRRKAKVSETKEKEIRKQVLLPETKLPEHGTSSETDTADEKSDLDDGEGGIVDAEAAEIPMAPAGATTTNNREKSTSSSSASPSSSFKPVQSSIEDEQRSPVYLEHSYCLPWTPKDGREPTFLPPDDPSNSQSSTYTGTGQLETKRKF